MAGIIFLGELPDKTFISSLIMSSKHRALPVWVGASCAFLVHVGIAVGAGRLILSLPKRPVEFGVALLFAAGGIFLFFGHEEVQIRTGEEEAQLLEEKLRTGQDQGQGQGQGQVGSQTGQDHGQVPDQVGGQFTKYSSAGQSFYRIAVAAFTITFIAEWGDLTQILIANFTARYHQPFSVGLGSIIGLWGSCALAVLSGRTLLKVIPMALLRKLSGLVLIGFAIYSTIPLL